MSSISSVSSATNLYPATNQDDVSQSVQDFQSIGSALQSGDLSTAQSALATFQKDLQSNSQTSASQPFGKNRQANTDYQSLTSALQSGDLSGAQKAFSSLKNDLQSTQSTQSTHKGHRHHHSSSATDATTSSTTSATTSATVGSDGGLNAVA
jgi:hypothetical protein